MVMATLVKPSRYSFDKASITDIRRRLGMSQAQFASALGVPANTLSRWERGETVPSADSLAAVYSLALARDPWSKPQFFRAENQAGQSKYVMVFWDADTVPAPEGSFADFRRTVNAFLRGVTGDTRDPRWEVVGNEGVIRREWGLDRFSHGILPLMLMGGRERTLKEFRDRTKYAGIRETALVFVTTDKQLAGLLTELQEDGIEVYLWAAPRTPKELRSAFEKDHIFEWNMPQAVLSFLDAIDETEGRVVPRGYLGNLLARRAASNPEFHPSRYGFTGKSPYGKVIDWLAERKFVYLHPGMPGEIRVVRRKKTLPRPDQLPSADFEKYLDPEDLDGLFDVAAPKQ